MSSSSSVKPTSALSSQKGFQSLPLDPRLLERLHTQNFHQPTPVQAAAIPQFLANRDVVVEACTGSGKTLAYVLPVVQMLLRTREERDSNSYNVGAVILSPTRELAFQIERVARPFCESVELTIKLLTSGGGARESKEDGKMRWDLIVGTPGRLDEWTENNKHRLKTVEVLVMDEADTLLSQGFHMQVQAILSRLPKQRRTGLFTATQAKEVQSMIHAGLRNPATIAVKVLQTAPSAPGEEPQFQKTPNKLSNYYKVIDADAKLQFLLDLIATHQSDKFIVFFATCASVDYFGDGVIKNLFRDRVFPMHGKMNPKRRKLTFENFAKSDKGVLTCTDVLARGIDLPDVDWIVQVDCPKEPDFFVHRVGRTARAGRKGSALLMLMPNEIAYVEYLKSQKVPMGDLPSALAPVVKASGIDIAQKSRELLMADRDFLERGTKAFVAYVAYYCEHRLSAIFQMHELDILRLVRAFHLLRLPKLKEFKNQKIRDQLATFVPEPDDVIASISFKDKAREEKRQKMLSQGPEFNQLQRDKKNNHAHGHDHQAKGKLKKPTEEGEDDATLKRKRKGKQERIYDEWDELAKEEQLFKRMRRGKLDPKAYEMALLRAADGDDDDE